MAKKMVYLNEGHVTIVRNVVARGYHLWLRCYLMNGNFDGLSRKELLKQFTLNVERILNGLQHPGYHRVEESLNSDGMYNLRIVPVTKATMKTYIAEFTNWEEGINDLESSLWLIEDQTVRSDAMVVFINLLNEFVEHETVEESDAMDINQMDF